jgi:hypothetical protein
MKSASDIRCRTGAGGAASSWRSTLAMAHHHTLTAA